MFSRRHLLASLAVAALTLSAAPAALAADTVIKVGTLKLIHGITPYMSHPGRS